MSWKTDNAVKRIFNAFKRTKNQIYKEDIEALKLLNDELVNSQKSYVNDNLLYAKLLSYILKQNLVKYGGVKIAIKSINDILKEPLENHIELLRIELNNQDNIQFFESLGMDMDFLNHKENNNNAILNDNQKKIIEKLSKFWDYDKVSNSFYNTANEFLKDVENYK